MPAPTSAPTASSSPSATPPTPGSSRARLTSTGRATSRSTRRRRPTCPGGSARGEPDAAYPPRTLAVLYVAGSPNERGALPLEHIVQSAHSRGIPVVVDG